MATKGKRLIHKYSEQALQDALNDIREGGTSILGASVKYGVPRSTIQDRLHGRVLEGPRRMGPPTILTHAEEKRLESRKWFTSFIKRHPSLSIREAEGISKGRAIITQESIRKWFEELKNFLSEQNALAVLEDPSRIFNGDETSFCLCPKTGRVLAPKGYRNVYSIQRGNEKETITVLLVFSASGRTTILTNPEASISPSFDNHLHFPRQLPSQQQKTKVKAPSAISALAWREHIQAKEKQKSDKAEAIIKRKLERQNRKLQKESKVKRKKGKQKEICSACEEELNTDAEDDDLKNVGCDTCPQWFHLKCTNLKNVKYNDIFKLDFICRTCKNQNV
ncbi:hypothetical protein EVAR_69469_1 [Eumeta japonica]|uniref:PHD-type domain-containing protein n=1 Tax=Eumeta variegata TaxID=151549 RepID=A0A4C1T1L2_EUMVA|nr:hypothetical protein EVAR_69469_1 [Eumeta japonica]